MSQPTSTSPESEPALRARARLAFLVGEFEEWLSRGGGADALVSQWQEEITTASRDYVAHLNGTAPEPVVEPVRARFLLIKGDQ